MPLVSDFNVVKWDVCSVSYKDLQVFNRLKRTLISLVTCSAKGEDYLHCPQTKPSLFAHKLLMCSFALQVAPDTMRRFEHRGNFILWGGIQNETGSLIQLWSVAARMSFWGQVCRSGEESTRGPNLDGPAGIGSSGLKWITILGRFLLVRRITQIKQAVLISWTEWLNVVLHHKLSFCWCVCEIWSHLGFRLKWIWLEGCVHVHKTQLFVQHNFDAMVRARAKQIYRKKANTCRLSVCLLTRISLKFVMNKKFKCHFQLFLLSRFVQHCKLCCSRNHMLLYISDGRCLKRRWLPSLHLVVKFPCLYRKTNNKNISVSRADSISQPVPRTAIDLQHCLLPGRSQILLKTLLCRSIATTWAAGAKKSTSYPFQQLWTAIQYWTGMSVEWILWNSKEGKKFCGSRRSTAQMTFSQSTMKGFNRCDFQCKVSMLDEKRVFKWKSSEWVHQNAQVCAAQARQ